MKCLLAILLVASSDSFSLNTVISPPIRSVSPWTSSRLYSTIEPSATTPPTPATDATPPTPATDASSSTETAKAGITSDQEKYGLSLDLPDTYVRCGQCAAAFAIKPEDLGARGRRISCSICVHSWYQTPDRLFNLKDGNKLSPLPAYDLERISKNIEAGREPDFVGTSKFYVGNLSFTVTEDDLRELFSKVGPVGSISMAVGPDGRVRGFAFVNMMEEDSYDGCLALDGKDLHGREISVKPPNN